MREYTVFTFLTPLDKHPYIIQLYDALRREHIKSYDFKRFFKIFKANIIHLHWIEYYFVSRYFLLTLIKFPIFYLFFLFNKLILKKRFVITLHNIQSHRNKFPKIEKFGFILYLNLANAIIVHNKWSKEQAIKKYHVDPKKVRIIPHGNFIKYYKNTISKNEARKKLKLNNSDLVILLFGGLSKYKGITGFIDFLEKEKFPNYKFIICGKPEDYEISNRLRTLSNQNSRIILIDKYILDNNLQKYFNACDIGILPYKKISTSGVLYLFASFGKSMILKDLESFRESLGNAGIYYKTNDDLHKILKNFRRLNLKKRNKQIFEIAKRLSWNKIAKKTFNTYQNILNPH